MIELRIKEERRRLKMTQMQLSKMLNIAQPTLAAYETGSHEPDIKALQELAKIFNCSIDYLLGAPNREMVTLTNFQWKLFEYTQNLTENEQQKVLSYIQGLLDNRN